MRMQQAFKDIYAPKKAVEDLKAARRKIEEAFKNIFTQRRLDKE